MARLATALAVLVAAVLVAAAPASAADEPSRECGTKQLYGRTLTIVVSGELLPCARVREIVRGRCDTDGRRWNCFSVWPPGPALLWYRRSEMFASEWSVLIEARRPSCDDSVVTAAAWREAGRWGKRHPDSFPNRRQLLADDLLRCRQLIGLRRSEVSALLGRPPHPLDRGRDFMSWDVGLERDSFFQIDNEVFSVAFGRDGRVRAVRFYQS